MSDFHKKQLVRITDGDQTLAIVIDKKGYDEEMRAALGMDARLAEVRVIQSNSNKYIVGRQYTKLYNNLSSPLDAVALGRNCKNFPVK